MADLPLSASVHLILLAVAALSLALARVLRRRRYRQRPLRRVEDLAVAAADEFLRELVERPLDLPARNARETVKVLLLRYEIERPVDDEG
jgi:hypothetical protein